MAMIAFDKSYTNFIKMVMHHPRPYMESSLIHSYTCSKSYGSPSGHSTAGMTFGVVIFLDIFHGRSDPYYSKLSVGWVKYILSFLFFVAWAFTMPFSRVVLGAHSFDQVTYGCTDGFVIGLILHFYVRDHLIGHIENILVI